MFYFFQATSCLPSLLQIHHEAIKALLRNDQYLDCLELCDKVLVCYQNNNCALDSTFNLSQDTSVLSQGKENLGSWISSHSARETTVLPSTSFGNSGKISDKVKSLPQCAPSTGVSNQVVRPQQSSQNKSQTFGSQMVGLGSCRKKRKFGEVENIVNDGVHFCDVDVVSLKLKAEALVRLGRNEEAVACLQR